MGIVGFILTHSPRPTVHGGSGVGMNKLVKSRTFSIEWVWAEEGGDGGSGSPRYCSEGPRVSLIEEEQKL